MGRLTPSFLVCLLICKHVPREEGTPGGLIIIKAEIQEFSHFVKCTGLRLTRSMPPRALIPFNLQF